MRYAWLGLSLFLAGCATLRPDPMIHNFTAPQAPAVCASATSARDGYLQAVERNRRANLALGEAERAHDLAIARSRSLASQPRSRSRAANTELNREQAAADQSVQATASAVSAERKNLSDADEVISATYKSSEAADVCRALNSVVTSATSYNAVAKDLSNSEAGAGGVKVLAAFAGASFLVLNPHNTDNIAGAALLGGGAEAWRSGVKPAQRALIYQAAADRLSCVVNRGGAMISFFPSELDMSREVAAARSLIFDDSQFIDAARGNPGPSGEDAAKRAAVIQRAATALTDLQTAADSLTRNLLARELADQRIYDAANLIRKNAADQLKGVAPDIGAVVDLIQKLPDAAKKAAPAAGGGPPAPAPSGSEAPKSGARALARAQTGSISIEEIRTVAARLEAEAGRVRSLQINDDETKYTAIAQCAAS